MNAVSAILFITAAVYAFRFYQETVEIFDYWLILATGAALAALWTGFITVEWLGIMPAAADQVEQTLLSSVAVVFALAAQAAVGMHASETLLDE